MTDNDSADSDTGAASEGGPEMEPKIAHHGAYIEETKTILRAYVECQSYDELKRQVVEENLLKKDTDYYRKNVLREVRRRYIPDTDTYTETPLMTLVTEESRDDIVEWCMYYEFAQDPFIEFVTKEFLYPEHERGTLTVRSEALTEFLEAEKDAYPGLRGKTEGTIAEAATKYLSAMKNFGLLEGRQKKEFAVTYVPDEAIAYVTYRLFESGATGTTAINHDDWELLMLSPDDARRRMRDISPQYVTHEKRGSTERLTPKFDSITEVINAF